MALNESDSVADFLSMVATATHHFKFSYSKTKDLPAGKSIKSPTLSVAGHKCDILYYSQGLEEEPNYIHLYLAIHCESAINVAFGFSFLNKHGMPASNGIYRQTCTFSPRDNAFGFVDRKERSDFEAEFVKDDYVALVCSVTILSDSYKEVPKQLVYGIVPYNINENFATLLENNEMADITFEVDGETFAAHKLVLSARSPVFKAELFGGMAESKMESIQIKDIKPAIFKAMLHFIYSDSLPDMSDDDIPIVTQVQLLLKAADRYALDGLKMICEEVLRRNVSMDTVVSCLALAEEHSCSLLKDVCLDFASKPKNLIQLALNAEYVELMHCYSLLLEEFGDHAREQVSFSNIAFNFDYNDDDNVTVATAEDYI
ncbi:BTB/POZ/MATH-domain protein [Rhynchospora pubera]|uniref:BTB/POZ/MATH-domain protein n=1 Tax=Rhynchospora pubera TaxID=906938 RepID=A0AAV8G623_9POAL|nr:BTB/POZ/MATH-domain protein [Rhynchospora pubera]